MWWRALSLVTLMIGAYLTVNQGPAGAANSDHESGAGPYVQLYLPVFDGPPRLATSVRTILGLKVLTTLRVRSRVNSSDQNFGHGHIIWSDVPLPKASEYSALLSAANSGSQATLWGIVQQYGSGIVVQSYLTIDINRALKSNSLEWSLRIGTVEISLGLPSITYEFKPLILSTDFVAKYSRPDAFHICKDKITNCAGRPLAGPFRELNYESNWAYIISRTGALGWVYFPDISDAEGDATDFTSGVISYLRTDFTQASFLFTRLLKRSSTGPLKQDVIALAAVSDYRSGSGSGELERALAQDQYSLFIVKALVIANLTDAGKETRPDKRNRYLERVRSLLVMYNDAFDQSDIWLRSAKRLVELLEP